MQHSLCQLILLNGFLSDASCPGVERLTVTLAQEIWLSTPISSFRIKEDLNFDCTDLLTTGKIFAVKGWNRSVSLLSIMLACFQLPELLEAYGCSTTNYSWLVNIFVEPLLAQYRPFQMISRSALPAHIRFHRVSMANSVI